MRWSVLAASGCSPTSLAGSRLDLAWPRRRPFSSAIGDTLVVWKLDRLGRIVRQLVEFVAKLNQDGVEFRSLTDGIDTTTPAGRFFFHMMAALAEMERDLTRERTMAGLAAARARGRLGGRPPALSPKQLTQARRLMQHPDQTMAEIAATLGVSRSTLYRSLRSTS